MNSKGYLKILTNLTFTKLCQNGLCAHKKVIFLTLGGLLVGYFSISRKKLLNSFVQNMVNIVHYKYNSKGCSRSKIAKRQGYILETKLFWPLVGEAKCI